MGKIFYIMGKSASGKDTLYKKILKEIPWLGTVIPYTTRPIREGEKDGVEYHFTTEKDLERMRREEMVIESRTYETVFGPWTYCTINDGQIDLMHNDYLMIGTLISYLATREYFGEDRLVPLYIEVENGERLLRAIFRERQQKQPGYSELCRRFLADEEDFSDEKLGQAGIQIRYDNTDLAQCLEIIVQTIKRHILSTMQKNDSMV